MAGNWCPVCDWAGHIVAVDTDPDHRVLVCMNCNTTVQTMTCIGTTEPRRWNDGKMHSLPIWKDDEE